MSVKISSENFIKAEKRASQLDLHISEALKPFASENGDIELLNARKVLQLVKPRPENSHKGSFGRLVLISGSDRFPGAAQIAALSALRSGVGLVTVISTKAACAALSVNAKEATLMPVGSDSRGFISASSEEKEDIAETVSKASALLIGPGLGTSPGCLDVLKIAIKKSRCPIILDADGINLVSNRIEFLRRAEAGLILTPHPAELSRLCGAALEDVLEDRPRYARLAAQKTGGVVVSKSAATLIAAKGRLLLSAKGNNALAKGGSGDFLAGLIASFAAQGYSPAAAATIGVTVQGLCCEEVAKRFSKRSVIAQDLIDCLPELFKKIERLI